LENLPDGCTLAFGRAGVQVVFMKAISGAIFSISSPFSENRSAIEVHEGIRIEGECAFTRMIKI
jgi:hypothetical protein